MNKKKNAAARSSDWGGKKRAQYMRADLRVLAVWTFPTWSFVLDDVPDRGEAEIYCYFRVFSHFDPKREFA